MPFECKMCSSVFKQMSGLGSHMLTHTKERPYVCEICKHLLPSERLCFGGAPHIFQIKYFANMKEKLSFWKFERG